MFLKYNNINTNINYIFFSTYITQYNNFLNTYSLNNKIKYVNKCNIQGDLFNLRHSLFKNVYAFENIFLHDFKSLQ